MRIVPFLTSLFVAAFLYAVIMERDTLLGFAGVAAAEEAEATAREETSSGPSPVQVVTVLSSAQPVESGITLRGRTEAARRVDVRSEVNGLVESAPLPKGSMVQAGEVLCKLDEGTRGAMLIEARARLAEADANNRAADSLAKRGFAAETTAISRVAQLEAARAGVEAAEKELERLEITAPFDGLLETDTAELGALLQPGAPCASLIDLDPIKLVGFVPERQVERIKVGVPAGARLVSGQEVVGSLTFLSRSADPLTRTFRVEVTVRNSDLTIRDGMTAEIFVSLEGETAHLLPQSVLTLDDDGRLGVRIAENGVARFRAVELIRDAAEGVWLAGLPETVEVIVVGQDFVTDGREIRVTRRGNQG